MINVLQQKSLGQFSTTNPQVRALMLSLVTKTSGRALEPSAGNGDLVQLLEAHRGFQIEAVELDERQINHSRIPFVYQDFFRFADDVQAQGKSYDLILANPPYVPWAQVLPATKATAARVQEAYSDKVNLAVLFMDRCLDLLATNGEMIFIVPKEWFFATGAAPLRRKLLVSGFFTHLIDCGEEKLFPEAQIPSLLIFRWVKRVTPTPSNCWYAPDLATALAGKYQPRLFTVTAGGLFALLSPSLAAEMSAWGTLGDQYLAKVGLVTGLRHIFTLPEAVEIEPEAVQYQADTLGRRSRFLNANHFAHFAEIPPRAAQYLLSHKEQLLARRIIRFDETNWWKFGAVRNQKLMDSATPRFYVHGKTRSLQPAFIGRPGEAFTGSLLGLFQKPNATIPPEQAVALLNSSRYRQILAGLMLIAGARLSLHPTVLVDLPFPRSQAELLAFLGTESL
jgi:adenine-specific DNA-methyltransferase